MTDFKIIGVTETLRFNLTAKMNPGGCPHCGRSGRQTTLREVSTATGVSAATLSRFLLGRPISSDVLDKLAAWVDEA